VGKFNPNGRFNLKQNATETKPVGNDSHVSSNIILKTTPCYPGHYDVTDVFIQDQERKFCLHLTLKLEVVENPIF